MRNNNSNGAADIMSAPLLAQLRGDMATMDIYSFMRQHKCSRSKYDELLEMFGIDELINFLRVLIEDVLYGRVEVPSSLKGRIIGLYEIRIIQTELYRYEKNIIHFNFNGCA